MGFLKYFFVLLFVFSTLNAEAAFSIPRIPDKFFDVFHNEVRPKVMTAYKFYYDTYGSQISDTVTKSYNYLAPKVSEKYKILRASLYNVNPKFYDEMGRLPAPLKRAHEELIFAVWGSLYSILEGSQGKTGPTPLHGFMQEGLNVFKARVGLLKAPPSIQKRVQTLLSQIKPYALDSGMVDCFRIYAVPIDYETAFSTGCNIFVFKGLYENYNDDELRAIIAHEMSHGINGDGLKKFYHITKAAVYHLSKLSIEELTWIATDEEMEYMSRSFKEGHMTMLGQASNKDTQVQELRADREGVQMLNAAGFSGSGALSALYKSERVKPGEEKIERNTYEYPYPPFYYRVKTVKDAMRF